MEYICNRTSDRNDAADEIKIEKAKTGISFVMFLGRKYIYKPYISSLNIKEYVWQA